MDQENLSEREFAAHCQRVEGEKESLRDDRKLRENLSFDEAIFDAAKSKLTELLCEHSTFRDITEHTRIFKDYRASCLDQIKAIVDVQICMILSRPTATFQKKPGRRPQIVCNEHDLLVRRTNRLIERLDSRATRRERKLRAKLVRLTIEETMSTIEWSKFTASFVSTYH